MSALSIEVNAQSVYLLDSGTTSIRLENTFMANAGLSVAVLTDTAVPASGFEAGFNIIDTTDFCFEIDSGFAPIHGEIGHSGSVQLDQGALGIFGIGNFEIAYGKSVPGKLELYDSFLGTRLFEINDPDAATLIGNDFAFGDSDLIVTNEFATFLQNGGLAGQVAGQLRIDGVASIKSVPEPQTALLAGIGLILLAGRRRRCR